MDQKQNSTTAPSNSKQQVIDALKNASNVLITVSQSPSIDQLASCIGLALLLNKMNKHATAIFSGSIPSAIDYLEPDKLLEGNTDSLRDFIISLDRDKADKLRYKVEDNVVRIFITPYRTSINESDLVFSQGDFNVDLVMALGVDQREHLDMAIMQQGRILHDATVIGVSVGSVPSNVGALNWHEPGASSLCELIMGASELLQEGLLDAQIANALLTGIVAETDRFRNEKTSAKAMSMSAQLIAAGANQQLVAEKLEIKHEFTEVATALQPPKENKLPSPLASTLSNDSFDIPKNGESNNQESTISLHADENLAPAVQLPGDSSDEEIKKIKIDEEGHLHDDVPELNSAPSSASISSAAQPVVEPVPQQNIGVGGYITEPPKFASAFTASENNPFMDQPSPINNLPPPVPILSHKSPLERNDAEQKPLQLNNQESARDAVMQAIASNPSPLPPSPITALNAQPMDLSNPNVNENTGAPSTPPPLPPPITPAPVNNQTSVTPNNPFNLPPANV